MIGYIVAEERFLHQGIDHHLYVTRSDENGNEFRFEVRYIPPGTDEYETLYERMVDFTDQLEQCPNTNIDQLINAELAAIRLEVLADEEIHAHDP